MKCVVRIFSLILVYLLNNQVLAQTQTTSFTSIPAAVNGTINVCAGSTILFTNTTANNVILQAPVTYNWDFGGGQIRNTNGPHAITYSTTGIYTVTLVMSSGGAPIPNNGTITVNVGLAPTNLPSILPANPCTNDTIINGTLIFQTSNGINSCSCQTPNQGPAIGFTNTSTLGGATITIYWGGEWDIFKRRNTTYNNFKFHTSWKFRHVNKFSWTAKFIEWSLFWYKCIRSW